MERPWPQQKMSVESGKSCALKWAGCVINTCKTTSGYSHLDENGAQNVLVVRVMSHMIENETIRILEFFTAPHQF